MDFRFDQDERDIVAQAGLTLRRQLTPGRLLDGDGAAEAWRAVAADGWLHAGLSEDDGGAGLPLALVAGIAREAGTVLAGDGYVDNAVVIARLLASAGPDALATHLAHPGFLLADGRTSELTGCVDAPVPWCFGVEPGLSAYCLTDAGELLRYAPGSWTFEPLGQLGLSSGTVTIDEAAEPELRVPAGLPDTNLLWAAEIAQAAALVGLATQALADAVDYVKQRDQFGGPIGRFQAVKHALADVSVRVEVAWNAVLYAALRPEDGSVAIARLQAAAATENASRAMIQYFGGIAMTWEHHAHLYLKTAEASRWRFGSPEQQELRVASTLAADPVVG